MSDQAFPGRVLFPDKPGLTALFALIAGLLLPLSLAPFDLWWSGPISILMLLAVLHGAPLNRALIYWYLFGIGQYSLGASWVYVSIHTHGGASVFLAATLTGLFVAGISLVVLCQGYIYQKFFAPEVMDPRWIWLLAFPALWFLKEWTTMWLLTGFPWALLGYGQIESPLSGYAQFVGVLGVGFFTVLGVCLFFAGVVWQLGFRLRWWAGGLGLLVLGLVLKLMTFTTPAAEPLRVSLIQGNVAQETKWRQDMVEPILRLYAELSHSEWGRDVIVWPEAAITLFADSAGPLLDGFDIRGDGRQTALLLGIPTRDAQSYFNSAVVVGDGSGTYVKRHLVPFGEYVPFEAVLRGLIQFFDLPMSRNKAGPVQQELVELKAHPVALSICYEIAFPNLVRRDASGARFLVTISNDTWFGQSLGPHQHMQMAQMRALENGRFLIRATNNGITAVVNDRGKIVAKLPQFQSGVLRANVVPMEGVTPYTWVGDWPLLLGLVLTLSFLLYRSRVGAGTDAVRQ